MPISVDDLMAEARTVVVSLNPQEAASAMADGACLIDTRCSADRAADGAVPGSVHHPRTVLEWRMDPDSEAPDPAIADRSLHHIIMCNDGYSSLLAGLNLARMGFVRISHLAGGFRAWAAAGLAVEAGPETAG
jgi:rhodanese-related sulfurtransferase